MNEEVSEIWYIRQMTFEKKCVQNIYYRNMIDLSSLRQGDNSPVSKTRWYYLSIKFMSSKFYWEIQIQTVAFDRMKAKR